jgi:MoaA/NifB/PqqE/SkfB family radical SAM enzyme
VGAGVPHDFRRRFRLKWFLARESLGFSATLLETSYRIYLNHTKVIHYRDGRPVYSLSTPALYSKPSANLLARSLYRTIQNKNLPNMMSLAVNDVCNARCEHCSFFEGVEDPTRTIMTTEQASDAIRQAQALGISVLNFVGGEPLLRRDLPELIKAVDKDLTTTVLFTNGSLLAERVASLRKAGLDSVYVSIDAADPERHDRFRGTPGLFDKAVAGVRQSLRVGISTGISCTMTPESFESGELDRMIKLGKELGVHEVLVFDAMPTGRYSGRADLIDNQGWVEAMIDAAVPYNHDPSYPGILVWAYTSGYRAVGCSCGTSYFYVSPYGDVMSCDFNHAVFGNVLATPLYQVWDSMTSREEFNHAAWGGCKVKNSRFREMDSVVTGVRDRRTVAS